MCTGCRTQSAQESRYVGWFHVAPNVNMDIGVKEIQLVPVHSEIHEFMIRKIRLLSRESVSIMND